MFTTIVHLMLGLLVYWCQWRIRVVRFLEPTHLLLMVWSTCMCLALTLKALCVSHTDGVDYIHSPENLRLVRTLWCRPPLLSGLA